MDLAENQEKDKWSKMTQYNATPLCTLPSDSGNA